jgi:hypothetical protein
MSTSSKLDRNEIFRLLMLKPLGDLETVKGFADDMEFLLRVDIDSFSTKKSDKYLHDEILIAILKQSDALLDALENIRFNENFRFAPGGLQAANLIQDSLISLRQQKQVATLPKKKSVKASRVDDDSIPFNYPSALIDSLREMRDAVADAVQKVKQAPGSGKSRDPEFIRKQALANLFVSSYYSRFKKFPPLTNNGAAHQVFVRLIYAANMSGEYHLHHLRDALAKRNDVPKRKRTRKGQATITSEKK